MTRVEIKYQAKLDMLESILYMLDNEKDLTIDDLYCKIKRSEMFYRRELAKIER